MDIAKRSAEAEKYALEDEISRLQEDLANLTSKIDTCPSCGYNLADYLTSVKSRLELEESRTIQQSVVVVKHSGHNSTASIPPSTQSSGWSAFNIFGYFFSASSSANAIVEQNTVIQRV